MAKQCSKCESYNVTPVPGDEVLFFCNECNEEMVPNDVLIDEPMKKGEKQMKGKKEIKLCSNGDGKKVIAKGLCSKCYYQVRDSKKERKVADKKVTKKLSTDTQLKDRVVALEVPDGKFNEGPELRAVVSCLSCIHVSVCYLLKEKRIIDPGTVVCNFHTKKGA